MTKQKKQAYIKLAADEDDWLDPKIQYGLTKQEISETIKDILKYDGHDRLTDFCYAILRHKGKKWKEQYQEQLKKRQQTKQYQN